MRSEDIRFSTGHVGLNVSDLARSLDFYVTVFGFSVADRVDDGGRRFAFLTLEGDPVLTLWEQADGRFPTDRPGLHHLSFRVDSSGDLHSVRERVEQLGAHIHHGGVVPHGEGATSAALFFDDPDGVRLEVFAADATADAPAPVAGYPTCGFF